MSFYGCHFSFAGVPCTEYGLMMYSFDSNSDSNSVLSADVEIVEDRISRRYTPLHYGVITNKPLEFTMTFGADVESIDANAYLDRWDLDAIAKWLTAHSGYKWLEITQPDMELFRYKCFITELKHVDIGNLPWGFSCKVICDSPFAYQYPDTFKYAVNGTLEADIFNKSSYCGYYKPQLKLVISKGGDFSIKNTTDGKRIMRFTGLPTHEITLNIDNENEIIICGSTANPYRYFNFNFLRLCQGINHLVFDGIGIAEITCEFPISIGG